MEAFKRLKRKAIIVYVNTEESVSERENLSPVVLGALYAPSLGNIIPKLVVTSPDQSTYYASMSYKQTKNPKEFRKLDKMVDSALEGKPAEMPKDAEFAWVESGSRMMYKGKFVGHKGNGRVRFQMNDGKYFTPPLSKLSKGAQTYLQMLSGEEKVEKTTENTKVRGPELWQSSKAGKSMEATFVSLREGKITLKKTDGKLVTFSLVHLSAKSQQRARELGGER